MNPHREHRDTMLTTQPLPTAHPPAARPPARAVGRAVVAIGVVALAAHLPLLARHAAWLWQRPHYQFFPLVLVGAGVLAYARLRNLTAWRRGSAWVAAAGLFVAWLLLAAAELLASQWLGCLAVMALLPALAYAAGGREAVRRFLPAWALLWLIVPPPLDLDRLLIFKLQNLTTGWSSAALDALGVYHVRAGNVIEAGGRQMMVEQACSGINSLFSVLACTLFLVFLTGRGWVRGGLLVAAAVGWVLAANVARVSGVVLIETRWGVNVSTGWRHEAFGLLLFAVAVGLLLSTDQLLGFLFRSSDEGASRPQEDSAPAAPESIPSGGLWCLAVGAVPAYLLLVAGHWALAEPTPDTGTALPPTADRNVLPAKLGPWEMKEFTTQTREAYSFYGEHSQVWTFSRGRAVAVLSLDYPFPGWHDLTWCYTGRGWHIDGQAVRDAAGVPGGFVEVRMTQSAHRHAYLLFCEFDRQGRPLVARPGGTGASLFRHQATVRRLRARLGLDADPVPVADPGGPVYQLQAFAEGGGPLTAEDEEAVREAFVRAQAAVREAWAGRR
jgi:exosortase